MPKHQLRILGPTFNLFPLNSFSLSRKVAQKEKDAFISARLSRMEKAYQDEGIRRSVEGVVLVHDHGHPFVLFLNLAGTFSKLPGGKLKTGEGEIDGLKRKLNMKLSPAIHGDNSPEWLIGELISIWWRPNFETLFYPYVPPHITRPKECKKIFIVQLAKPCNFEAPSNYDLKAVPLFELYENRGEYGPINASIPSCLSRFNFIFL
ncbi:uncharacterized protein LOC126319881 [Schistocerca gregaria]|uniref:uncharacterized protein LOC126319881 n=1 Tax=Schistocerca gregaria TaxID=7010 RepID=UPI00211DF696|nr:uncharacterized protein LOC126319881 [Schistocerca gregaria]